MSAVLDAAREARFEPMTADWLPAVTLAEQHAYTHPWTLRNFRDALDSGYESQVLVAGDTMLGYFIAMRGVDEVHLLNITVAPAYQRQGWARVMLDALAARPHSQRAQWLWLEVRASNLRAFQIYAAHGFRRVGVRKGYYPDTAFKREDAIVMSLQL